MDICLVTPTSRASSMTVPAAMLFLHGWMVKKNIQSKIIDVKIGRQGIPISKAQKQIVEQEIIEQICSCKPKFVGMPCYTPEFWEVINLSKKIKDQHDCKIIIGGLHTSIKPSDFFYENSPIDLVVVGDGQVPLAEIILKSRNNESLDGIDGVILPSTIDGSMTEDGCIFDQWDAMPIPDYSQLDMGFYTQPHAGLIRNIMSSGIHIFTTIGCPYQCTFCANRNRKVRFRPIQMVLDEVEMLKKEFNIDSFYILDDTFLIQKSRVEEFIRGLEERGIDLIWAMETRVNILDEEIIKLLCESKCIQIDFGIESGSPDSLKRMKKGITTEQIINAFNLCRKYKIRSLANFMFNTPGETKEDVEQTIEMIRRVRPTRAGLCLTIPFPGTAIYNEYVHPQLTKEEYDIYNTKYLYVQKSDPRFNMTKHDIDLVKLRFRVTAEANGLRSVVDYCFNPHYIRSIVKSKRKMQYFVAYTSGFMLLIIEKASRLVRIIKNKFVSQKKEITNCSVG